MHLFCFAGAKVLTFFDTTKLFGDFLYKKLLSGVMEPFQVLITACHHPIVDVTDPPGVGDDEGQSDHTHEDIGFREPNQHVTDARNHHRAYQGG